MNVSEVQVNFIKPKDGIIGFASCIVGGCLYLSSIAIHQKANGSGYRLTYPTKKIGQQSLQIFHPINRTLTEAIEGAIFDKLNAVMEKCNAGYGNANAEPARI